MPSSDDTRLVPSVLDRLVDLEPASTAEVNTTPPSESEFRKQVARDIWYLLNSRSPAYDVAAAFPEVGQSVIAYGLPDFSARSLARQADREAIRLEICAALAAFEPRLSEVAVTPLFEDTDKSLRLHVEAQLAIGPARRRASFDIDFSLLGGRCDFKVRG